MERERLIGDEKSLAGLMDEATLYEREGRGICFQGMKVRRRRRIGLIVIGGRNGMGKAMELDVAEAT